MVTGKPDPLWSARVRASEPRDAIAEIVRRARATSIVILNEAHHSPRDRAFAWDVARALRPLGYSILAAETFKNDARAEDVGSTARLAQDGFVRLGTGTYTRDPVFADFVRRALVIGYRPVAYEQTQAQRSPTGGVEEREQAQADNLRANTLGRDPSAKILVLVGHSHVAEAPILGPGNPETSWMAARLKRATGIDPLTIDQTSLTDLNASTRSAHAEAARRLDGRPGVLFEGERPLVLGQFASAVDLQVVHPARSYVGGRPSWLARMGRRPVDVPKRLLPKTGRRLVQAFAADAPPDAVPLDQLVVTADRPASKLMLPDLEVRYAVQP